LVLGLSSHEWDFRNFVTWTFNHSALFSFIVTFLL
jgi:hypothetical protein